MQLISIAVALWFAPLVVAGLAAAPATVLPRYRGQLKRWLVG